MYHAVPPSPSDPLEETYYSVPRSAFVEQLDQLDRLGLAGVDLESALDGRAGRFTAITFDDGHWTHYEVAFPELVERGMSATFFVTTDWVGRPGFVTWDQVREMAAAGMSIQSHTVSHPLLSELTEGEVVRELVESKRRLEAEIGREVAHVALPGGDFPRGWTAEDFAGLGYRTLATSRWGPNAVRPGPAPIRLVRRYTVRHATTRQLYSRLAAGSVPARSPEGLRLAMLNRVRRLLGADRYRRWRARILDSLPGSHQRARRHDRRRDGS